MFCIPIIAGDSTEALNKIARANTLADMLELRLDLMHSIDLREMIQASRKPVIVTYRSKTQGGQGSADPETSTEYLLSAIREGADFVDVELGSPRCRGGSVSTLTDAVHERVGDAHRLGDLPVAPVRFLIQHGPDGPALVGPGSLKPVGPVGVRGCVEHGIVPGALADLTLDSRPRVGREAMKAVGQPVSPTVVKDHDGRKLVTAPKGLGVVRDDDLAHRASLLDRRVDGDLGLG